MTDPATSDRLIAGCEATLNQIIGNDTPPDVAIAALERVLAGRRGQIGWSSHRHALDVMREATLREAAHIARTFAELMSKMASVTKEGFPIGPEDAKYIAAFRAAEDIEGRILSSVLALAAAPASAGTEAAGSSELAKLADKFAWHLAVIGAKEADGCYAHDLWTGLTKFVRANAPAILAALRSAQPLAPDAHDGEIAASEMSAEQIAAELRALEARWNEVRTDDDGHSGSPGEWIYERMGELENERRRRAIRPAAKETGGMSRSRHHMTPSSTRLPPSRASDPHPHIVEVAARALCKANGNCVSRRNGADLCPNPQTDCRDSHLFMDDANAALTAVAPLLVAEEREAAAKICDAEIARELKGLPSDSVTGASVRLTAVAAAIRARASRASGETGKEAK